MHDGSASCWVGQQADADNDTREMGGVEGRARSAGGALDDVEDDAEGILHVEAAGRMRPDRN